ncbi:MAG: hypothetical protein KIT14_04190 [bacterium]|nr:hypothetical protein [bacterium]
MLVALIAVVAWQVHGAMTWRRYLAQYRLDLQTRTGFVAFEDTALARTPLRALSWGWTHPPTSVLLQAMDGEPVRTVIENPAGQPHQLFDPRDAAQWPDLSPLGVETPVRPGATPAPR